MTTQDLEAIGKDSDVMAFAYKMVEELRNDLISSFKRLAEQNETTEENVQLAMRFRDLPTGEGDMYYQLLIKWKPSRLANFNRDFLGMSGKEALFPDDSNKEAFIKVYVLGQPMLKIEGLFTQFAKKYGVTKWSDVSGIFYKLKPEENIKLGIFIAIEGKSQKVETIDIFSLEGANEQKQVEQKGEIEPPVTNPQITSESESETKTVEPVGDKSESDFRG